MNELPISEKTPHAEVNYQQPSKHFSQHCSLCKNYIPADPPRCRTVAQPIRPGDWCNRFERKGEQAKAEGKRHGEK